MAVLALLFIGSGSCELRGGDAINPEDREEVPRSGTMCVEFNATARTKDRLGIFVYPIRIYIQKS